MLIVSSYWILDLMLSLFGDIQSHQVGRHISSFYHGHNSLKIYWQSLGLIQNK